MKLSEFKHQLSTHNLEFEETVHYYLVLNSFSETICKVSKVQQFIIDTDYKYYSKLPFDTQDSLFALLTQFSTTPISERNELSIEEQTKHYIKNSIQNNLSFKKSLELLEDFSLHYNGIKICSYLNRYSDEQIKLNHLIYCFYRDDSNEFVKIWNDVLNSKGEQSPCQP